MEKMAEAERITMMVGNKVIDVTKGIDRLHVLLEEKKNEPGKRETIDCPICGAKAAMTYVLSPYNGHLHARCTACHVSIMQ